MSSTTTRTSAPVDSPCGNPARQLLEIGIADLRLRRHRNRAPLARASATDAGRDLRCVLVARRDLAPRRAADAEVGLMTSCARVALGERLVGIHGEGRGSEKREQGKTFHADSLGRRGCRRIALPARRVSNEKAYW